MMKIIKDKKLFGKLNIIDIILIVVILLLALGITYKVLDKEVIVSNNNHVFNYILKISNVRPTSGEMVKVGDAVYQKVSGKEIGKVVNVINNVAETDMTLYNGVIEKKNIEGRIDITLEIQTNGLIKNDDEYYASGSIRILHGSTLPIQTKYLDCTGMIIDIKSMEE